MEKLGKRILIYIIERRLLIIGLLLSVVLLYMISELNSLKNPLDALVYIGPYLYCLITVVFALYICDFQYTSNKNSFNQNSDILNEIKTFNHTLLDIKKDLEELKDKPQNNQGEIHEIKIILLEINEELKMKNSF